MLQGDPQQLIVARQQHIRLEPFGGRCMHRVCGPQSQSDQGPRPIEYRPIQFHSTFWEQGQHPASPRFVADRPNLDHCHLRRHLHPASGVYFVEYERYCLRFQANPRLSLIVKWPVQAGYIEVDSQLFVASLADTTSASIVT
jgi:hypothetical protein